MAQCDPASEKITLWLRLYDLRHHELPFCLLCCAPVKFPTTPEFTVERGLKLMERMPISSTESWVLNPWPSKCCRTTSPMRHCKDDRYKHDSQRQRHDETCGFAAAGEPRVEHTCAKWCSVLLSAVQPGGSTILLHLLMKH